MSSDKNNEQASPLTRRKWLVLSLSATATACGGGGDIMVASMPGTGGTGIGVRSTGPITGFGSVIVNRVRFDDTNAQVTLDGQADVTASLRLGMVVNLQGERDATGLVGKASAIDVWSIAQGQVSSVSGTQFTVAGMVIQTDPGTVLDGVVSMANLTAGDWVRVWGLQSSSDASTWNATRVAVVQADDSVSSGLCLLQGSNFYVNGLRLTETSGYQIASGTLVRVQGTLRGSNSSLALKSFIPLGLDVNPPGVGEVEVSGLVTSMSSNRQFILGNVAIDARLATIKGGTIAIGQRVEVEGNWQGTVIVAKSVEIEDSQSLDTAEIEAKIEEFVSLANFVVRGQRCDGSGLTQIQGGSAADLKVGVKVHVTGIKKGEILYLTKLEIDH
ncbi:MAG: hypothetical protein JZU58_29070 [Curvibacter lanceolatus]|jgi:hypothetical protein|uniref:DUF5666 domain-containing protein n=1 Tax=Curvibacter lanceolatus TaxID=86182 RepID=UPI00037958D7|nr:DUF5666 domain-containing protein [Curvibacter lanceolatus]MBV5296410.1 hypothetical protein [Curvibacter lanceolatus]